MTPIKASLVSESDHRKGVFYFNLFVMLQSACYMLAKYIYISQTLIVPSQLLTMVTIWATFLGFIYVNKDIKSVMFTQIPRNQIGLMVIRCLSGAAARIISFSISKYVSLMFIGLTQNAAPLITIILSRLFNGERINYIDIAMILVTFAGVTMLTVGDERIVQTNSNQESFPVLATIGAFIVPVLMSINSIVMRKMKGLPEIAISLYMNPLSMLINVGLMLG